MPPLSSPRLRTPRSGMPPGSMQPGLPGHASGKRESLTPAVCARTPSRPAARQRQAQPAEHVAHARIERRAGPAERRLGVDTPSAARSAPRPARGHRRRSPSARLRARCAPRRSRSPPRAASAMRLCSQASTPKSQAGTNMMSDAGLARGRARGSPCPCRWRRPTRAVGSTRLQFARPASKCDSKPGIMWRLS